MMRDYEMKVVSGQLVLLHKALTDQIKKDVLNGQLYAQLYASVKADKFSETIAWDARLTRARAELKWSAPFTLARRPQPADKANINATTLIMEQFAHAPHFDPSSMEEAIRSGLNALASSPNAQKVFFDSVLRVTKSDSSLKTVERSEVLMYVSVVNPEAHMIDVQVGFSVHQLLDEHLFDQWFAGKFVIGSMLLSVSEFELDTSAFSDMRGSVLAGLDGAEATLIVDLDLPPPLVGTLP